MNLENEPSDNTRDMKKTLYLKLEIDWEDYDDVSDELLFQDWLDSVQIDIVGTQLDLIKEDILLILKNKQGGLTKKN